LARYHQLQPGYQAVNPQIGRADGSRESAMPGSDEIPHRDEMTRWINCGHLRRGTMGR
jgi:hypothetical protein